MKLRLSPMISRLPVCTGSTRLWKYFRHVATRCVNFLRARSIKVKLALCLLFFIYLHLRVFPRAMGSYNDRCYLSPKEYKDMQFLLTRVTEAFNKLNATYWLDFGTLISVWKSGEIFIYDGDIDIGRLFNNMKEDTVLINEMQKLLLVHNISISGFQAEYNGKKADLFRWKINNHFNNTKSNSTKFLEKWYPFKEKFGLVEGIVNYLMPTTLPFNVLLPTRELTVYGTKMSVPNKALGVIKIRYPLTWFISFPYKWKCWFS